MNFVLSNKLETEALWNELVILIKFSKKIKIDER